jgi:pimeloyl-ACP methyl ester carboxylesterase
MTLAVDTSGRVVPAGERMISANGIDICVETLGDRGAPPVLLIMGANSSMLRWPVSFCRRIADAGRCVIRYDNRDTGRSTAFPPAAPGYNLADMARDAVGVLDALGIECAHVAGFSLGGMVVQHLALDHPARVLSALIAGSSPDPSAIASGATGISGAKAALPPPAPVTYALMEFLAAVNWDDRDAAIAAWIREERDLVGSGDTADDVAVRETVIAEIDRARNVWSQRKNHPIAITRTPSWRGRLSTIGVPVTVVQGTSDYCFPLGHGRALAAEIPGARLIEVPGMGHILGPGRGYWDMLADAIIARSEG